MWTRYVTLTSVVVQKEKSTLGLGFLFRMHVGAVAVSPKKVGMWQDMCPQFSYPSFGDMPYLGLVFDGLGLPKLEPGH
jgi:hypothetical protein